MTMTLSSTIGRPSTMQDLQLKTKPEGLKLGSMESGVLPGLGLLLGEDGQIALSKLVWELFKAPRFPII
jgi:hypothetical protein